jgi:hypothetical protein
MTVKKGLNESCKKSRHSVSTYIVVPFLKTVHLQIGFELNCLNMQGKEMVADLITPGSFFKDSFRVARTGGDVSNIMVKWLEKGRRASASFQYILPLI